MAPSLVSLLLSIAAVSAQSFDSSWGSSGGSGSVGGIGDASHPVTTAQSFITDGLVTNIAGATRQLASGPAPVLAQGGAGSRRQVVVDSSPSGAAQQMLGFGHAWTDSTVQVFNQLGQTQQTQLMQDLFGQDGNNMGFMRHTIGSSDLSGLPYSYDDAGALDSLLSLFNLTSQGTEMTSFLAKMGQVKGDVFLLGAPWSYPAWMKTNSLFITPAGSNDQSNTLNPNYYSHAVKYLSDYIDAYKKNGVTVNAISVQNEPLNYQGGYPTMYLPAAAEANLLQNGLGAAMHQRGVKIFAYDHNTDHPEYPAEVIQSASQYVDAAAWHCYEGPVANYSVLSDFRSSHPSTPQFMTECSNTAVKPGTDNFWMAQNFMPAVRNGASGGAFWVLGTDPEYGPHSSTGGCTTCSPAIVVNSSTIYTKTIDYWMMGQFSRYIRRGGVNHHVISGQQGTGTDWGSQFYVIAVQNPDQGWAVVFLNTFSQDQAIDLSFTQSGLHWQGTIPASTVVTWLLPADAIVHGGSASTSASWAVSQSHYNKEASATSDVSTTSVASSTSQVSVEVASFASSSAAVTSISQSPSATQVSASLHASRSRASVSGLSASRASARRPSASRASASKISASASASRSLVSSATSSDVATSSTLLTKASPSTSSAVFTAPTDHSQHNHPHP